ncbi:MAG: DinB family protein [bacterium]|jgi:uncharacterized damage-inducible protein DinB
MLTLSQVYLPEFDQEMANTRRVLERVPDDKLDYTPHPKSKPMAWLANHVATIPEWVPYVIDCDSLDLAAMPPRPSLPSSREQLLAAFDAAVAVAREKLSGASDEHLLAPWRLKMGENVIFEMPRASVYRTVVLNHLIHHRGQLTIFFRLNDVPLPALYGPSADEQAPA